jgi:hypothetical protein
MLDVTKPMDQILVSEIPGYIRSDRAAINALLSGIGDCDVTNLVVTSGTTELEVGTNVSSSGHEVLILSATGSRTLSKIVGGIEGQVKVIIFLDANIDLQDGLAEDGKFYLNQLPALSLYSPVAKSKIALVNIGGNGSTEDGYWTELYRTDAIK